jgi:ferredoxin
MPPFHFTMAHRFPIVLLDCVNTPFNTTEVI